MTAEQWKKVGKGAAIAFLSAGIVSLGQYVSGTDFGEWNALVQALVSVAVNAVRVLSRY